MPTQQIFLSIHTHIHYIHDYSNRLDFIYIQGYIDLSSACICSCIHAAP